MSFLGSLGSALTGGLLGGGGGGGGVNVGGPGQHTNTNLSSNTSTNYATNNSNTGSTLEYNILGNPSAVNLTDGGAVQQAFNFANQALQTAVGNLSGAQSAFQDTQDALQSAYQQSLSFIGKTTTPPDTQTQNQMTTLIWGVLIVAGLVLLNKGSK